MQTEARQNCLEGFAEKTQIPGFAQYKKSGGRKKGANVLPPAGVIVNFVGEKEFGAACAEEMLQLSLPKAMEVVSATALQDSEKIETSFDDLLKAFSGKECEPTGDVIYSVTVEVVPTIKWTGDYRKLSVTVTSPGDDETDALEAEAIFNTRLRGLGTMRVVVDRGLEIGDQAVMDLEAVNAETRTPIDGDQAEEVQPGHGRGEGEPPGFDRRNHRDETGGAAHVPDHDAERLAAGVLCAASPRTSRWTCARCSKTPSPTPRMTSRRKFTRTRRPSRRRKRRFSRRRRRTRRRCSSRRRTRRSWTRSRPSATPPLPASIVEETGRQMYSEKMLEAQIGQQMSMDVINQLAAPEMVDEYLRTNKESIELIVRRTVACEELFRLENIEVTEEEFKAEVVSAKEEFERYGTEYDVQRLVEQAGEVIEARKSLDWLREHATITIAPPAGKQ